MRIFFFLIGITLVKTGYTQDPIPAKDPGSQLVELDLIRGTVKDNKLAPFDIRPLFIAKLPDKLDSVLIKDGIKTVNEMSLFYIKGRCPIDLNGGIRGTLGLPDGSRQIINFTLVDTQQLPRRTLFGQNNEFVFSWLPDVSTYLQPNQSYCLLVRRYDSEADSDPYQRTVSIRTAAKFGDYVKLDFGIGYSPQNRVKAWVGTIALHGYLLPINNDTDIAERFGFWKQMGMRVSLYAGIAPITFGSQTRQDITPLTGVGNLVTGIGFRGPLYWPNKHKTPDKRIRAKFLLQAMRLNLGYLLYAQQPANPLETGKRTKATPYIGITYDFNLTTLLGPIAKLFGAG